jgi:hypothetical protein
VQQSISTPSTEYRYPHAPGSSLHNTVTAQKWNLYAVPGDLIGINGTAAPYKQTGARDIDTLINSPGCSGFSPSSEQKYLSLHPGAPVDLVTSDEARAVHAPKNANES